MDFDKKIDKLADILVNYSLGEQFRLNNEDLNGKKIVVLGEVITEPLMVKIEEKIVKSGAFPLIFPFFKNHTRRYYPGFESFKYGDERHWKFIPDYFKNLYDEADGFINVLGSENITLPNFGKKEQIARKEIMPLLEKRTNEKKWTLALYPTKQAAKFEGMDFEKYANYVLDSSIIDYSSFKSSQQELEDLISQSSNVLVRTENKRGKNLELYLNIKNRKGISCHGYQNVPDGEVYTSPNAYSLEGEVFLDVPIYKDGIIEGVYLRFKNGRIVEYSANNGEEFLKTIIETDEGSRQIGEFAFGTNYMVNIPLKEILFAEKIGGTCHMAIGCSYDEPYDLDKILDKSLKDKERKELIEKRAYSHSAQHLDIPFHPKEVYLDGREVKWDGRYWRF